MQVHRLSVSQQLSDLNKVEAHKRSSYTADITQRVGDSVKLPVRPLPDMREPEWDAEPYGDDSTPEHELFEADLVDAAGQPIMMHSLTDALINA